MNERIKQLAREAGIDDVLTPETAIDQFALLIVRECGYYADVFEAVGCPVDMYPTETKPSDYIKKQLGIENEQV